MLRKILPALCCALALTAPVAQAEAPFPTKPIRLVVPFAPGGSTDLLARLVADDMRLELGPSTIVENRAGAAGNIGGDFVARLIPDGHTVLVVN